MAGSVTYVLNIIGPDTFLYVSQTTVVWYFRPVEVFFKRRYTGVDPQEGWVIDRDQRGTWNNLVLFLCEEIKIHLANLRTRQLFHIRELLF